jgi:hypothetical protein
MKRTEPHWDTPYGLPKRDWTQMGRNLLWLAFGASLGLNILQAVL